MLVCVAERIAQGPVAQPVHGNKCRYQIADEVGIGAIDGLQPT
jgi:hypothetical protein